jgi:hypothetical protein
MKLLVIKTQSGLKPVYDSDYEIYIKIPIGEQFEIEYKKQRNLKFHKKMFALFKLAFENQEAYSNLNDLRRDLTITAGYYTESANVLTGEVFKHAKSISFASMDGMEFNNLYEAIKTVIIEWLGVTDEQIETEILQYF